MQLDFDLLSMTELRNRPGEILDRVSDGDAYIIERNGRRRACLVPFSYFFPDIPPQRIADEIKTLEDNGEDPKPTINEARELVFTFVAKMRSGKEVKLTVTLPHGYPDGCPRIQADGIDPRSPHRWSNGDLCVFGVMSAWNPGKHTVFSTLQLGRQWLCRYDEWMGTGVWGKKENV
jgi:prevent-host-death family protein